VCPPIAYCLCSPLLLRDAELRTCSISQLNETKGTETRCYKVWWLEPAKIVGWAREGSGDDDEEPRDMSQTECV
jgi:hypothetical protein